ncbi:hypothetical protein [Hoeflea olei]|uniref:Uncharacterized protein n=1 Tax=Hoeflea olei TaxID=1480615 RepID=A0A1C1YQP9_9HYPH|nr:hypothetical protein [Hoeflea olei]OCW55829.1 hypothetical protein AWJ14_15235 [Hoeflea olei]
MKDFRTKIVIGLAAGAFAFAVPLATHAQQAGGVSVGGNGTGGLGVSADVGGVDASASIGGGSVADVDASVGGADGANASASVGANGEPAANVDANIGAVTGDVDINAGNEPGIAAALGFTGDDDTAGAATPGTGTPGIDPGMTGAISSMSDAEVAAYKKKCVNILRAPASFDSDLVDLCRLVREAAAR